MSKRKCRFTEHHLIPKCRGGSNNPENKIQLPWKMHKAYHHIFGTQTIKEAISHLKSFREKELEVYALFLIMFRVVPTNQIICFFVMFNINIGDEYKNLFGNRTIDESVEFLKSWRVGNLKKIRNNARIRNAAKQIYLNRRRRKMLLKLKEQQLQRAA